MNMTEFPLDMMQAEIDNLFTTEWQDKIKLQILSDFSIEKITKPDLTLEQYLIIRLIYAGPKTWYTIQITNRYRDGRKA